MGTLYPEDRVAPKNPKSDLEAIKTRAIGIIRASVPRGGKAKTFPEIVEIVRNDSQCYVLFSHDILPLIKMVKEERPAESQAVSAVAKESELGDLEAGEGVKPK